MFNASPELISNRLKVLSNESIHCNHIGKPSTKETPKTSSSKNKPSPVIIHPPEAWQAEMEAL